MLGAWLMSRCDDRHPRRDGRAQRDGRGDRGNAVMRTAGGVIGVQVAAAILAGYLSGSAPYAADRGFALAVGVAATVAVGSCLPRSPRSGTAGLAASLRDSAS